MSFVPPWSIRKESIMAPSSSGNFGILWAVELGHCHSTTSACVWSIASRCSGLSRTVAHKSQHGVISSCLLVTLSCWDITTCSTVIGQASWSPTRNTFNTMDCMVTTQVFWSSFVRWCAVCRSHVLGSRQADLSSPFFWNYWSVILLVGHTPPNLSNITHCWVIFTSGMLLNTELNKAMSVNSQFGVMRVSKAWLPSRAIYSWPRCVLSWNRSPFHPAK